MSACCMGFASTGQHEKSCAMGKAASEAAPEYASPIETVKRQLSPKERAKVNAKIDALIEASRVASLNALQGFKTSKDKPCPTTLN